MRYFCILSLLLLTALQLGAFEEDTQKHVLGGSNYSRALHDGFSASEESCEITVDTFIGFVEGNAYLPSALGPESDSFFSPALMLHGTAADFCEQIAEHACNTGLQTIEYCVLKSIFLGKTVALIALLECREDILPYLRTRFYNNNAMLTHLAASSPYASQELLQALFSRGFCSKARTIDDRMAWQVAENAGNDAVAAFAKSRAMSCKKNPPATPTPSTLR